MQQCQTQNGTALITSFENRSNIVVENRSILNCLNFDGLGKFEM